MPRVVKSISPLLNCFKYKVLGSPAGTADGSGRLSDNECTYCSSEENSGKHRGVQVQGGIFGRRGLPRCDGSKGGGAAATILGAAGGGRGVCRSTLVGSPWHAVVW